jgi:hypothetical protein
MQGRDPYMAQVFVSYSHANVDPVSRLAAGLEQTGYAVWWDRRLRAHQQFGPEIEAALRGSHCAIVAWSTQARDSLWVRAEATEAWEAGKLVQVTLDGAKPPLPFTMIHVLNLARWSGQVVDAPWSELREAVDLVIKGAPAPQARPARLGGFGPAAAIGIASIGLVLIAAGVVAIGVKGAFSANVFGVITAGMFLAALVAFAHMLTRIVKVAVASR